MKNTVIVVDDSELIRNIMVKALEDEYTVIEAKDGREAIEMIRNNKEDVIYFFNIYKGWFKYEYASHK